MYADRYISIVQDTIRRAWEEQPEVIGKTAAAFRTALEQKHSVFLFG